MLKRPDFYLVLNEAIVLRHPLKCWLLSRIRYAHGNDCFLANVSPPIPYRDLQERTVELKSIIIAARYEGKTIVNIKEWPVYVNIMKFISTFDPNVDTLSRGDLEIIALGKIYSSIRIARKEAQSFFDQSNSY